MWRETDAGDSPTARPAAEKLPLSATFTKSRIVWSVSIVFPRLTFCANFGGSGCDWQSGWPLMMNAPQQ